MIALIMGSSIVTALVVGWYGHKAYVRIQAWGEKMNEQDAILQSVSPPEELASTRHLRNGRSPRHVCYEASALAGLEEEGGR